MIPAPQEKNWNPRLREYENLARDADFQLCMRDMVERTGVTEENLRDMFISDGRPRMEVYTEFAKCFVPKSVDPINNYELYEIAGDYALNKSTFGYLFRILFPLLSAKGSPQALSYMDAVKAFYVSTKFYSQLPAQLGLTEFLHRVCYDNQSIDRFLSSNNKKIEDLYEDLMEAFIGCLELQIDRYIGMHRGYVFVANFVFDLLESMNLDFRPSFFWESARLLKETNDSINSYNKTAAQKLPRYTIESIARNMFAVKVSVGDRDNIDYGFGQINGDRRTAEAYFAPIIIDKLSKDPRYRGLVKRAPTAEELGIESLFK